MPWLPFRIALFLSSYAPLFGLLAWTSRTAPRAWVTLGAVSAAAILALLVVLGHYASEQGPTLKVRRSSPRDGDVLAYVATYLIPFLGLNLTRADDAVLLVGFLAVLGTVYVNSNMLFVNPVLSLLQFHVFSVTDIHDNEYTLITRRADIDPETVLRPAAVTRYLRLEVRRPSPRQPDGDSPNR